ncbi:ALG2 [Candida oxycetoniae]|uniref:Alpha-1,3/1,6-mannosyltransferase ALG2 n=1 Tax=Candida oxycetoniae TaxID=497107 RepID=A0AAI9SU31_9ASCO|nr:ALG2 [Candida oxycetoniae]KAI3403047.2 ALG2 [Candida oxycetoniae]
MTGKIRSKRIAFIHPDLGIGGAERLVVDAAVGLQELGSEVTIYTSHCDLSHCFDEVASGQLKVKVYGDFLPTQIRKRFHILFAIMRQFYLTLVLIFSGEINKVDYFIVDQLSFCIPLLNLFSSDTCRILFYCHFPDQLLTKRNGWVKSLYRVPFDFIEEASTGCADQIVVNSNFTKKIFHDTFKNLTQVDPGVIYPCVNASLSTIEITESDEEVCNFFKNSRYFLSINRFERSKEIELAIKAFAKSKRILPGKPRLVIAGGYDSRVVENVEYLKELTQLCDELKLTNFTVRGKLIIMPPSTDVLFLPSIRTSLKNSLLKNAELLLYTPGREHFGIVPVESMQFKTPVLARNFGGPLETVVHFDGTNIDEATGFVESGDYEKWAKIMIKYFNETSEQIKKELGNNGYKRAMKKFSRIETSNEFAINLQHASKSAKKNTISIWILFIIPVIISIVIAFITYRILLV